jgi:hypothetical protein
LSDLFLLDANALIDAHETYYSLDRVPGFWLWLIEIGKQGRLKIPVEVYEEVAPFRGPLPEWLRQPEARAALTLPESSNLQLVQQVLCVGYARDLDDVEIEEIGKDPFLVAAAMSGPDRVVVTREVSKKTQIRAKRRLPDVCDTFGVRCINDVKAYAVLNFTLPV